MPGSRGEHHASLSANASPRARHDAQVPECPRFRHPAMLRSPCPCQECSRATPSHPRERSHNALLRTDAPRLESSLLSSAAAVSSGASNEYRSIAEERLDAVERPQAGSSAASAASSRSLQFQISHIRAMKVSAIGGSYTLASTSLTNGKVWDQWTSAFANPKYLTPDANPIVFYAKGEAPKYCSNTTQRKENTK